MPKHKTTKSKSPIKRLRKTKADDTEFIAAVGARIRNFRAARNWTLREFTELTGVPKSVLLEVEHGKTSTTILTLQKIASTLEIPVVDLLNAADDDTGFLMETMRQHPEMVAVFRAQAKEIKERCEREAVEPSTVDAP